MEFGGVALIWGPPRSGTTWLFNVVRAMLQAANIDHASWVSGQRPVMSANFRSLVIKSHQAELLDTLMTAPSLDHVYPVVMLRNAEDTFQSLIRTQDEDRDTLLHWLERDIGSIKEAAALIPNTRSVSMERIHSQPEQLISELATYLGVALAPNDIAHIARSFSRESVNRLVRNLSTERHWTGSFQEFDSDTQWHANHIAPADYVGTTLTSQERATLWRLQDSIDELLVTHSLSDDRPPSHSEAVADHAHCISSVPEQIIRTIEGRWEPRRWRDRIPLRRRASVSR